MNKLEQAARQALGALVRAEAMYGQPNADIQTALRSALADSAAFSSEALSEPPTTEELIQHRYEDHQLNGETK